MTSTVGGLLQQAHPLHNIVVRKRNKQKQLKFYKLKLFPEIHSRINVVKVTSQQKGTKQLGFIKRGRAINIRQRFSNVRTLPNLSSLSLIVCTP